MISRYYFDHMTHAIREYDKGNGFTMSCLVWLANYQSDLNYKKEWILLADELCKLGYVKKEGNVYTCIKSSQKQG